MEAQALAPARYEWISVGNIVHLTIRRSIHAARSLALALPSASASFSDGFNEYLLLKRIEHP